MTDSVSHRHFKPNALPFLVISIACLLFSSALLLELDQIVHGTLYSYGLQFSMAWARPYWNTIRFALVCNAVAVLALVASLFQQRPSLKEVLLACLTAFLTVLSFYVTLLVIQ